MSKRYILFVRCEMSDEEFDFLDKNIKEVFADCNIKTVLLNRIDGVKILDTETGIVTDV